MAAQPLFPSAVSEKGRTAIPGSDVFLRAFFHKQPKQKTHLNHKDTDARRPPNSVFIQFSGSPCLRVSVVNVFACFGCGGAATDCLRLIHFYFFRPRRAEFSALDSSWFL
jgi:hypothetical protein